MKIIGMSRVKLKPELFLKKYIDKIASVSFIQLVKEYSKIEAELVEEIYSDVNIYLNNLGYQKGADKTYRKDNILFERILTFTEGKRCLSIFFPDFKTLKTDKVIAREVNEFGLIRKFELHYSSKINVDFETLFEIISMEIRACYNALEVAFVRGSSDFSQAAYRSINTCFESMLKLYNKEYLSESCFFLISDNEFGYCYFDDTSMSPIIDKLKKMQNEIYSPFQIMVWLISTPFPFKESKTLEAKKAGSLISTIVTEIPYIHKYPKILRSIMIGLNSDDISIDYIHTQRNYTLSVTFPSQHRNEIEPLLLASKEMLKESFKNGIKSCSPLIKTLKLTTNAVNNSQISNFVASVIAKFGAEMIK